MIASFADHAKKKEEKQKYKQLVELLRVNSTQISTWTLIVSITNNVKQHMFSNSEAKTMVRILCTEFDIRGCEIQYYKTFSSTPFLPKNTKASNTIHFASKEICRKENNERLISHLYSAIQQETVEYHQALNMVIQILENYPDADKYLQS